MKNQINMFKFRPLMSLLFAFIVFVFFATVGIAAEPNLVWKMYVSKHGFYPGEPVAVTIKVSNSGKTQERVLFSGPTGINNFSFQIENKQGHIVSPGRKIERWGYGPGPGGLKVSPGRESVRTLVLNQWCSTLLQPGEYLVTCDLWYPLESEIQEFKAGPIYNQHLECSITITDNNDTELKKIIERIANSSLGSKREGGLSWQQRRTEMEMIVFTESVLAVPYQIQVLKDKEMGGTWIKIDAIDSLVRSQELEAAQGLMQIIEENKDCPYRVEDIKSYLIDGVYRLRETNKADIVATTNEFVAKYKRPEISSIVD